MPVEKKESKDYLKVIFQIKLDQKGINERDNQDILLKSDCMLLTGMSFAKEEQQVMFAMPKFKILGI